MARVVGVGGGGGKGGTRGGGLEATENQYGKILILSRDIFY